METDSAGGGGGKGGRREKGWGLILFASSITERLCQPHDLTAKALCRQLSMAEGRIKTASLGAGFPPWLHCIPPSMDFHPL